jgi:hypothetical protein
VARFFVTVLAVEVDSETRVTSLFGQYPCARYEGRVVSHVLIVAALKLRSPVAVLIFFVASYLSFHRLRSRT